MAKNKRKISSAQRDKSNIERAKILKKAGIISKQAKLHAGKFISHGVLRKVREYEHSADLGYKTVKVSREMAKAAKERGFQVVGGNKIIGPATTNFKKRLKSGQLTGVRPVKGGMMEEVILPHTVYDLRTLAIQLEQGIDTLKLPSERFAFKYHGNESYRSFMNTKQLLEYLRHYKGVFNAEDHMKPEELQEEFDALTVFRLHPNDEQRLIRGPRRRREDRKQEKMEAIAKGEYVGTVRRHKRMTRAEKLARMNPDAAERLRVRFRKKEKQKVERLKQDPDALAKYRERAKARAKLSRQRKKGE